MAAGVAGASINPGAPWAGFAGEVDPDGQTNDAEPNDCHHNQRLHKVPRGYSAADLTPRRMKSSSAANCQPLSLCVE